MPPVLGKNGGNYLFLEIDEKVLFLEVIFQYVTMYATGVLVEFVT